MDIKEIKNLKAQAHHLKPIVQIGKNGLTESVLKEIDAALEAHELIKIKFQESALDLLSDASWVSRLKAEHVDTKGHIVILYREKPEKDEK
ncbi:MAG: YhbY family RNA-binding protein [Deltaproteobacteria bacterium]|nr:YhbY family RNA-binding protein [Deltaproteobacteria bacterium]